MDTTDLPELPEGWCWTTIGEAFDVQIGATPSRKRPEYWGGEYHWVSSGEVAWNRITTTKEKITAEGLANTSTSLHPPGTVLLGMIGEGKTRGQAAILEIEACNNQNSAAIRVSHTPIPPEYVFRYLQYQYEQTRGVAMGNSQPALNKSKVESIPIPLLPLTEIKTLIQRVESSLAYSDNIRLTVNAMLFRLTSLDQCILRKAFRGELVPQNPNDEPASVLLERIRAEKAHRAGEEKGKRKGKGRKMKRKVGKQQDVLTVLRYANRVMTPEEVFAAGGFEEESVDAFYEQLRNDLAAKQVREIRKGNWVGLEATKS